MSAASDPDRLERLANYLLDVPPNTTPAEVAEALEDAAARIRDNQNREHQNRDEIERLRSVIRAAASDLRDAL